MSWLSARRPLPMEQPLLQAVKIYAKRLSLLGIVLLANLLLFLIILLISVVPTNLWMGILIGVAGAAIAFFFVQRVYSRAEIVKQERTEAALEKLYEELVQIEMRVNDIRKEQVVLRDDIVNQRANTPPWESVSQTNDTIRNVSPLEWTTSDFQNVKAADFSLLASFANTIGSKADFPHDVTTRAENLSLRYKPHKKSTSVISSDTKNDVINFVLSAGLILLPSPIGPILSQLLYRDIVESSRNIGDVKSSRSQ